MNTNLQTYDPDSHRLISGLKHALDMNYARLLETAKQQSDLNFAGKDPSDASVSVRISSGDSQELSLPRAGVLRRRRRSVLSATNRGAKAAPTFGISAAGCTF